MANYQQSKQYNPSTALYVWYVDDIKILQVMKNNILTAITNIRLRKQHELEIGKSMIERQTVGSGGIENETEEDKARYLSFCKGLDRLDNSIMQLDESLLVMEDISK